MSYEPSTIEQGDSRSPGGDVEGRPIPGLLIAWSAEEPRRVGEVALFELDGFAQILGRGDASDGGGSGRTSFGPRRFTVVGAASSVRGGGISREQLRIEARRGKLHVERIGRCPVLVRGERVDRCTLSPGDTLLLKGQLLLLCITRPSGGPALRNFPAACVGPYGGPDKLGIVGESAAIWALRETLAFQAKAGAHALVLGPSGSGKELVARALHALSPRSAGPFVARNAATLPVGLLEAEMFGNVKNYPNPGMAERPGLVGAAEGGTLFLDEMGDLPSSLHASLLRVLDGDGEYHRLGEAKARRAQLRFVGATNRAPESLKHDLLARLPLRLLVPGLDARREDIPLLIRHLLRQALEKTPELVRPFVDEDGEVRLSPGLVEELLHRAYSTHLRELEGALWAAMADSRGSVIEASPRAPAGAQLPTTESTSSEPPPEREEPTADELRASIAEHGGNLVRAAKALRLPSRYVLYRLLRKHGIDVGALRGGGDGA